MRCPSCGEKECCGVDYSNTCDALQNELDTAKGTIVRLQQAYLPGNWEKLDEIIKERDRYKQALEFSRMTINHALALDYCGEGSTKGMCEEAVKRADEALQIHEKE